MPDFRVADTAPEHRKLRTAGLPAAGLWAMAGGYAMRELTDGWVPAYFVQSWPNGTRSAAALVRVGLWTPETLDGIKGYRFHDWHDVQRSVNDILVDRAKVNARRQLYATPALVAAIKERDQDQCRYCARQVYWNNRRGPAGATFDHVIPIGREGGTNTLDNVVVSCRACNAGKADRTPAEAGMTLLPPPTPNGPRGNRNRTSSRTRTQLDPELDKNSPPHPPPLGGGLSSSTREGDGSAVVDPEVNRRGMARVRSELDAARAARRGRQADAG